MRKSALAFAGWRPYAATIYSQQHPATATNVFASDSSMPRLASLGVVCWLIASAVAEVVPYAGVIGGVATLSADAGSHTSANGLTLSSYSPENGAAVNVFGGLHLHDYFSLQANYIWNRNDLTLNSATAQSNTFYQQARSSSQQAFILDFLVYFQKQPSRIRPYLGTGGGVIHLTSSLQSNGPAGGNPTLPPDHFSSLRPVFRSHVGIDLRVMSRLDFRYSFSEMIGTNDISRHLSPPAPRRLANFQNLFGFVVRF
jgi:hypothetical protein